MGKFDAGMYWGVLKDCGYAAPGGTKAPYVWLQFEINNHDVNGEWVPVEPTLRTVYLYTSESAWPFSKDKLSEIGFAGNFGELKFNDIEDGEKMVNVMTDGCNLECNIEEYQGKDREKWNLGRSGGSGFEHTEASKEDVRRMNAKWQTEMGKAPSGSPPAPASAQPSA